jgi:hypothetical protein
MPLPYFLFLLEVGSTMQIRGLVFIYSQKTKSNSDQDTTISCEARQVENKLYKCVVRSNLSYSFNLDELVSRR